MKTFVKLRKRMLLLCFTAFDFWC